MQQCFRSLILSSCTVLFRAETKTFPKSSDLHAGCQGFWLRELSTCQAPSGFGMRQGPQLELAEGCLSGLRVGNLHTALNPTMRWYNSSDGADGNIASGAYIFRWRLYAQRNLPCTQQLDFSSFAVALPHARHEIDSHILRWSNASVIGASSVRERPRALFPSWHLSCQSERTRELLTGVTLLPWNICEPTARWERRRRMLRRSTMAPNLP